MKLTILLPALNEEKTIGQTISEIQKELPKTAYALTSEILVVDNGSTDHTASIATELGARVVKEKRRGYGSALQRGIKEAKGEFIIMGDCDRSYRFCDMNAFLERLESGNDFVIGNRFQGRMEKGAMPWSHRYIGTPIISWLGKKMYHIPVSDFNCGLRAMNRKKILELDLTCTGMEYASEMLIKAQKKGLKIVEVPIDFYQDERDRRPHLRTVPDGIRHFQVLFREMKRCS